MTELQDKWDTNNGTSTNISLECEHFLKSKLLSSFLRLHWIPVLYYFFIM